MTTNNGTEVDARAQSARALRALAFIMLAGVGVMVVLGLSSGAATSTATCPAPVSAAVQKAYPSSKVTACKRETEHGKVQYEVKLETKEAKKLELDITPAGSILQTEESVAVAAVPKAVISAFDAKYPKMKPTHAAKQTKADGTIAYELAWKDAHGRHEATFKEDGSFLEEE